MYKKDQIDVDISNYPKRIKKEGLLWDELADGSNPRTSVLPAKAHDLFYVQCYPALSLPGNLFWRSNNWRDAYELVNAPLTFHGEKTIRKVDCPNLRVSCRSRQDPEWEKPLVFRVYSVYAWVCPLVLVLVGVVLDATKADVIRPHIDTSCWFYGKVCRIEVLGDTDGSPGSVARLHKYANLFILHVIFAFFLTFLVSYALT